MMSQGNGRAAAPVTTSEIRRKMLAIFADGEWHTLRELFPCLYEQDAPLSNVRHHLTMLRKELNPIGQDIISERVNGQMKYRHVKIFHLLVPLDPSQLPPVRTI